MSDTNDNERWLSDGNCDLCRRQKYCKKICKPHQIRQRQYVMSMATSLAFDIYKDMKKGRKDN